MSDERKREPQLYESDVLTWAGEQSGLLARLEAVGIGPEIDWPKVIRTVEDGGREELRIVERAVSVILESAIKGYIDPDSHDRHAGRCDVSTAVSSSGPMPFRRFAAGIDLDALWMAAFDSALPEIEPDLLCGVPPGLPPACPFTWADLAEPGFTYETAVSRLYDDQKRPTESAEP